MPKKKTNSKKRQLASKRKASVKRIPATKRKSRLRRRNKRRKKNSQKANFRFSKFLLLMMITMTVGFLAIDDFEMLKTIDDFKAFNVFDLFIADSRPTIEFSDDFHAQANDLALLYPEGREVVYLDVMTIQIEDWVGERLDIGGHDHLDRTLPIIAFLSKRNLGTAEIRSNQTHTPTGWDQFQYEIDDALVWVKNRGHLIAYTFTFNFNDEGQFVEGYLGSEDNPANLFTQTAHANQNVMTRYEEQVRTVLADGGKVIYKAAPIFRDDELMARGIWLQALSTCEELMYSVYIFNEQPGVIIDHETGANWRYP